MRVTCGNVDEFLANLADEPKIHLNTIYLSRTSRATDGKPQAVKRTVYVQLSAVVLTSDSDYLLESGEACGFDTYDSEPLRDGTDKADEIIRKVEAFAKPRNIKIRPGVVSE